MAQFGAFYACRESFIPFSPPRSRQREFCTEREAEIELGGTTAHQAPPQQEAPEEPEGLAAVQAAAGSQGQHGLEGLAPHKFRT